MIRAPRPPSTTTPLLAHPAPPRVRPRVALRIGVSAFALAFAASCGGCECRSDQDCPPDAELLLCVEGSCVPRDPEDVEAEVACDADDDCPDGHACALDDRCYPAPPCLRIDHPALNTITGDGRGTLASVTDGCAHTVTTSAPVLEFSVEVDRLGVVSGDCTGTWVSAAQAGALDCAGQEVIVALGVPCSANVACDDDLACVDVGLGVAGAGVCR
jgi:hypothetical protein